MCAYLYLVFQAEWKTLHVIISKQIFIKLFIHAIKKSKYAYICKLAMTWQE